MLTRRAKLAVTTATIVAGLGTWVGVTCGCPVPSFGSPAPTANVWVNPAGSDAGAGCVRSSSLAAAPADLTTACLGWNKAYQLANCGDTVGVSSGAYPLQTLVGSGSKSCAGGVGTCNAATDFQGGSGTTSSCVTFKVASDATASLSGSTGLRICTSYFRLLVEGTFTSTAGVNVGSGDNFCGTTARHDLIFEGPQIWQTFILDGTYNVAFLPGVSFGPRVNNASKISMGNIGAGVFFPHDILFDGVTWHDFTRTNPAQHMECLHAEGQMFNITIRKSRFKNCAIFDLFLEPIFLNGANGVIDNVLIENSSFDVPCSHKNVGDSCTSAGALAIHLQNLGTLTDATVRFNSVYGGMSIADNFSNGTFTGNRLYGNNLDTACPASTAGGAHNWTQDYNVYSGAGGAGTICSGDATSLYSTSNGYADAPNYDLHIGTGAAAKNLVPAAISGGAPTTDLDGDNRPISTNYDAGVDERS